MEGEFYHKGCFRCSHGGCALTPSSFAALNGILYCKHHFSQLFKEKGSYNHLIKTALSKRNSEQAPVESPKMLVEPVTIEENVVEQNAGPEHS